PKPSRLDESRESPPSTSASNRSRFPTERHEICVRVPVRWIRAETSIAPKARLKAKATKQATPRPLARPQPPARELELSPEPPPGTTEWEPALVLRQEPLPVSPEY